MQKNPRGQLAGEKIPIPMVIEPKRNHHHADSKYVSQAVKDRPVSEHATGISEPLKICVRGLSA